MNSFYFEEKMLLTGQQGPVTGDYVDTVNSRDGKLIAYTLNAPSNAQITLQYPNPFTEYGVGNGDVSFYNLPVSGSGYSETLFLTTPMTKIRAVVNSTGRYWASITLQN